jgi:hypothetical protein
MSLFRRGAAKSGIDHTSNSQSNIDFDIAPNSWLGNVGFYLYLPGVQ